MDMTRDICVISWNSAIATAANGHRGTALRGCTHRHLFPVVCGTPPDLAARNVLVDDNNTCKISDFGLSRLFSEYIRSADSSPIALRWVSIETLQDNVSTLASDQWSFGVVVWEIYSLGIRPYTSLDIRNILSHLESGNRLTRPKLCPENVYAMMCACWTEDPEVRPGFLGPGGIVEQLAADQGHVTATATATAKATATTAATGGEDAGEDAGECAGELVGEDAGHAGGQDATVDTVRLPARHVCACSPLSHAEVRAKTPYIHLLQVSRIGGKPVCR